MLHQRHATTKGGPPRLAVGVAVFICAPLLPLSLSIAVLFGSFSTMGDFVHGDQADRVSHDAKGHHDIESGGSDPEFKGEKIIEAGAEESDSEIILARELQQRNGILHRMRRGEEWLDEKMGIETQGIDRIHEEDKKPPSILNVFFLWWSLTCHVGTIPIGMLGPDFGLSFNQSVAGIVVGTVLGALCTAYCGTLGPKVHHLPILIIK